VGASWLPAMRGQRLPESEPDCRPFATVPCAGDRNARQAVAQTDGGMARGGRPPSHLESFRSAGVWIRGGATWAMAKC